MEGSILYPMMKQKLKFFIKPFVCLLICYFSFTFFSCVNNDDFNLKNLQGVEWTGSYALPIVSSTLNIRDLINDQDSLQLKEKEDGMIYFEYTETVLDYNIKENFEIPSRSFSKQYDLPAITLPAVNQTVPATLNQVENSSSITLTPFNDIVYMTFSEGSLSITANNHSDATISFKIDILNAMDNSLVASATFNALFPNSNSSISAPLLGKTLRKDLVFSLTNLLPIATSNMNQLVDLSISLSNDAKASEGEILLQEDVVISSNEPLDFNLDPEQYHEFLLKAGKFDYTFNSDISYNAEASFSLPTFLKDNNPFSEAFTLNGGTKVSSSDLTDYKVDLTTLSPAYNRFPLNVQVVFKPSSTTTFKWKSTDKVSLDLGLNNFDYKYLKGFFGNKQIPLESNTFNIDLFDNTLDTKNFSLKNPQLFFNVYNDYGLPVQLNFTELSASNDTETKNILTDPSNPIDLAFPANVGDPSSKTVLNITNGQEIFDLGPTAIAYGLNAELNKGFTSGNNFIADTSKVKVEMHAEIDLWGKARNMEIGDTLENSLEQDIDQVDVEFVKLKAIIVNQFPIDARVQVYFADDNYLISDSLFTPEQSAIVPSSTVDANGDLIEAGKYDQVIEVNKDKFERLIKAPNLIIKGTLETAESGQKDVKIKSTYNLDVKIGLQTKLNIKAKF